MRGRRLLALLVAAALALRLPAVYPPGLDYDAATIALQASQILGGDRPLFWTGQAYQGTAGAYLVAALFAVFGKSTLVLSLLAWTLSSLWVIASVLLALRLYGETAATVTALYWLVPSEPFMYWSATARTDRLGLFVLTPLLLLLTHAVVTRFREGRAVTARVLALGLLSGFAFWHNMAIAPCLLVCVAVLWLHLRAAWHRRLLWVYAAGALATLSPVLLFQARAGFEFAQQVGGSRLARLPAIAGALVTEALPAFWGMRSDTAAPAEHPLLRWLVVGWMSVLFAIYLAQALRRWRRGEDLLAEQLVLGLLLAHPLVLALSSFGGTLAGRWPLLYLLSLYGVAFLVPGAAIARCPRAARFPLLLPLACFAWIAAAGALPYARNFAAALDRPERAAVARFPDPDDRLIALLRRRGLSRGYVAGHEGRYVNLRGLGLVTAAGAYEEQYQPYAREVDAAAKIFWIDKYSDLDEAFAALGCRFEQRQVGADRVYFGFRREEGAGTPIEEPVSGTASPNPAQGPLVLDRRFDTAWELPPGPAGGSLLFELPQPELVTRLTLVPRDYRSLPQSLTVQGSTDGVAWTTLRRLEHANAYFWTLGRPMVKIVKPRCEIALAPGTPVRFLRVQFAAARHPGALAEVYLYRAPPPGPTEADADGAVETLAATLAPLRATHTVVGDHRLMSLFAARGLRVEFLPNRYADNYGHPNPALGPPAPLDFSRPLAIVLDEGHIAGAARRLRERGVRFETRAFPGLGLLLTEPARPTSPLYWSGFDLLALGPR